MKPTTNEDIAWERRILLLSECAWADAKINSAKVEDWLRNFNGKAAPQELERRHAAQLLQHFIYFGNDEITECLRALYRDYFVYPAVQELKTTLSDPFDIATALNRRVERETVFVGVGLPAESGPHFLYRFRAVNDIPTTSLLDLGSLFVQDSDGKIALRSPEINHLVFIDDLCGSGQQVLERHATHIAQIRSFFPKLKITYFLMFATAAGIARVQAAKLFDVVEAAVIFDADYKAFGPDSLCYRDGTDLKPEEGRAMAETYGKLLWSDPLGHDDGQLLLGFHHNTPDNSLPIFWFKDDPSWYAIFPRTIKK